MSWNPYKNYYEAAIRDDDWSGVDAEKARQKIKDLEEEASLNGYSIDDVLRARRDAWDEMGG